MSTWFNMRFNIKYVNNNLRLYLQNIKSLDTKYFKLIANLFSWLPRSEKYSKNTYNILFDTYPGYRYLN